MDLKLPTCGQLERKLSQSIQKLYRQELGHTPSKVICQLFGNRVAIVIEDALTTIEKTLVSAKQDNIVKQLNLAVGKIIKNKLKILIEEILAVKVQDLLLDTTFETCRTGAIAILSTPPLVRNPQSIPKNNYSNCQHKTS